MGKFYSFLLGLVAGFGAYHLASSHHVIRTDSGLHTTPKVSQTLAGTYVDIRGFTPAQWAEHPALVAAIAKSGDEQLVAESADGAVNGALQQLLPATPSE